MVVKIQHMDVYVIEYNHYSNILNVFVTKELLKNFLKITSYNILIKYYKNEYKNIN